MAGKSVYSMASRYAIGSAAVCSIGAVYYSTTPRLRLDSAYKAPTKTLSFPSTMLSSRELSVTAVEQINHDTKRITFALPGGKNEISGVTPGAAILTQHTPEGKWFPVLRPYTPVNDLDEPGTLQLMVKRYSNGRASGHIHSLTPGQTLTVRGPLPGYSWKPSTTPCSVMLVAGGAGITPIYSLTKGILSSPADQTRINLVWGVNGTRDLVLKDELEKLESQFPERLRIVYAVSGPEAKPEAPSLGNEDKYRKGYVNRAVIEDAARWCEKADWGDGQGTKVFLCGPPAMEDALAGKKGVLGGLGLGKKEIHRF